MTAPLVGAARGEAADPAISTRPAGFLDGSRLSGMTAAEVVPVSGMTAGEFLSVPEPGAAVREPRGSPQGFRERARRLAS